MNVCLCPSLFPLVSAVVCVLATHMPMKTAAVIGCGRLSPGKLRPCVCFLVLVCVVFSYAAALVGLPTARLSCGAQAVTWQPNLDPWASTELNSTLYVYMYMYVYMYIYMYMYMHMHTYMYIYV